MLGVDAVVGVGSGATTPGIEVHGSYQVRIGGFDFRRTDLTFFPDTRPDLEAVATAAPARWAVSALAEAPEDPRRQERAAAAVRSVGAPVVDSSEVSGRFELTAIRVEGGGILGGLLLLLGGTSSSSTERFAYLLTPDVELADQFAAHRGRLAGALADTLCPLDEDPDVEGIFDYRARNAVERFLSRLSTAESLPEDTPAPGPSIVRAVRGSTPVDGPRVRQRHRAPAPARPVRGPVPGALQGVFRRLVHGEPFARRLLREEPH